MKEKEIQDWIRLEVSRQLPNVSLFRNNMGQGFIGTVVEERGPFFSVLLKNFRRIKFGLFKGSGDLIGLTRVKVTPDMIGKTVAIFTSIEVKKPNERPKEEQVFWHEQMQRAGAISAIVHTPQEAIEVLNEPFGV